MIFDPKDIDRLGAMGINSCEYEQLLTNNIGSGLSIIPRLLDLFWKKPIADISSTPFNDFYASTGLPTEGDIYDLSYDFFNYLMLFNRGGKLDLYKYRQAEWKGPIIRLSRSDVSGLNLHLLEGKSDIYRGMSTSEFESRRFGQSWTTDVTVAARFATDTYEDQREGLVAVTSLDLARVIYVFPNDDESEVVISGGHMATVNIHRTL